MGNVIPWSQIHPSIKSEEPFVAVVVVDPQRQLCISELVDLEAETLADVEGSAGAVIAAAQSALARVAGGYRLRRRGEAAELVQPTQLRLIQGGLAKRRR